MSFPRVREKVPDRADEGTFSRMTGEGQRRRQAFLGGVEGQLLMSVS